MNTDLIFKQNNLELDSNYKLLKPDQPKNSTFTSNKPTEYTNYDNPYSANKNNQTIYNPLIYTKDRNFEDLEIFGLTTESKNFIRNVRPLNKNEIQHKICHLQPQIQSIQNTGNNSGFKPTLILDLDETLMHNVGYNEASLPTDISIMFYNTDDNTNSENNRHGADYKYNKELGPPITTRIRPRPYVQMFVKSVSQDYELILYTAGKHDYAMACLEAMGVRQYFSLVLARQFCVEYNRVLLKDLRIIRNRSLADIMIVDNYIYSFALHLGNGIPIKSFKHQMQDQSLLNLLRHLNTVKRLADAHTHGRFTAFYNKIIWNLYHTLKVSDPKYMEQEMLETYDHLFIKQLEQTLLGESKIKRDVYNYIQTGNNRFILTDFELELK